MRTVEIAYRYETQEAPVRPRPADSDAALLLAGFDQLGDAIVKSSRVTALLAAGPEND
jgi:hypothetical protein